jgi:hypothetical protein
MTKLLNGDCLEEMKSLDDKSVDFIFCDLPYGQTSCKWDCCIDLEQFWKQIMRIKKLNTPIFFTTTTKFGVSLINSAPKKCFFRYDLVWVKSSPVGFLSAKKMPMRKHEMIYVFYEKLPFYDLSSHKHKFIKQYQEEDMEKSLYGKMPKTGKDKESHSKQYEPPLPVSVVKEEDKQVIKGENNTYNTEGRKKQIVREKAGKYEPPLPVSVVKEDIYGNPNRDIEEYKKCGKKGKNQVLYDPPLPVSVVKEDLYGQTCDMKNNYEESAGMNKKERKEVRYDPPLPVSVVKEEPEHKWVKTKKDSTYGEVNTEDSKECGGHQQRYDPPLPVSVVKEEGCYGEKVPNSEAKYGQKCARQYEPPLPVSVVKEGEMCKDFTPNKNGNIYSCPDNQEFKGRNGEPRYDPPLPVSVVKEEDKKYIPNENSTYGDVNRNNFKERKNSESIYYPPLPNSMLEIKSTRGKHSTEKPVALIEWLMKYYSKEGDVVLDPTMGSGSTGVACKNMNRNFIGIEMDKDIYEVARKRILE